MIYFAIIDDDPVYIEDIRCRCEKCLQTKVYEIRTYGSYAELMQDEEYVKNLNILISDIELKAENGIQAARKLKEKYEDICVLFISSYIKYAPLAYDVEHLYFVLKDQMDLRFDKAVNAAIKFVESKKDEFLQVKWKGKIDWIPIKDIIMIERQNRKTRIVTEQKDYFTYVSFKKILESLDQDDFIRVHFSYVIQLHFVKHFERDHVILKNDEYVPISRTYEKEAKDIFLRYLSSEVFF